MSATTTDPTPVVQGAGRQDDEVPVERDERPATTVRPMDLGGVPEVDRLLQRLGHGTFVADSLTAPIGRNTSWAGPTSTGTDVFVKRLATGDAAARFARCSVFESHVARSGLGPLKTPRLLGQDDEHHLLVFENIRGGRSGSDLMVTEEFTTDLAATVGAGLAHLHGSDAGTDDVDTSEPFWPPLPYFAGLPYGTYLEASAAELEAWRLLQADDELHAALGRLKQLESAAVPVPSHCDLRVDQLLVAGDDVHLADWEEFRLADAARDVGSFAGEWLFRSVLDIVTDRGDTAFMDLQFSHDVVMQRGAEKLTRLLPLVHAFWQGYRDVRPDDSGLGVRATAFAGWHLLDRLVAGAVSSHRLTGIQRAAAGIGRQAVLDPERFAGTLGLQDAA